MLKEIGDEEYLKKLQFEYELQPEESNLNNPELIFAAFEQKFSRFIPLTEYFPIFKFLLRKGFEYIKKSNYSGVEVRIVIGFSEMINADFSKMAHDDAIRNLYEITREWQSSNPNIGLFN